jgi:hypothetical protein
MNPNALIEVEARLHRLEQQNRILILLLLAVTGIGSIAATNHAQGVFTASEIRTPHLSIVDERGTVYQSRSNTCLPALQGGFL